jgi:hypothetical protein
LSEWLALRRLIPSTLYCVNVHIQFMILICFTSFHISLRAGGVTRFRVSLVDRCTACAPLPRHARQKACTVKTFTFTFASCVRRLSIVARVAHQRPVRLCPL